MRNKKTSEHFYNDGQVRRIFSLCKFDPMWFIIGGPSDGNEAQVFKQEFPYARVVGFEPNPDGYLFQIENGFPGELRTEALWSLETEMELYVPSLNKRRSSLIHVAKELVHRVHTITLDDYDALVAHKIKDAVLWIDIEESELECLIGARDLLFEKRIMLVNAEVSNDTEDSVTNYLEQFNYRLKEQFDKRSTAPGRTMVDNVYMCEDL